MIYAMKKNIKKIIPIKNLFIIIFLALFLFGNTKLASADIVASAPPSIPIPPAGSSITQPFHPNSTAAINPIALERNLEGGYKSVLTLNEMITLPCRVRKIGMMVWVKDTAPYSTGGSRTFRLIKSGNDSPSFPPALYDDGQNNNYQWYEDFTPPGTGYEALGCKNVIFDTRTGSIAAGNLPHSQSVTGLPITYDDADPYIVSTDGPSGINGIGNNWEEVIIDDTQGGVPATNVNEGETLYYDVDISAWVNDANIFNDGLKVGVGNPDATDGITDNSNLWLKWKNYFSNLVSDGVSIPKLTVVSDSTSIASLDCGTNLTSVDCEAVLYCSWNTMDTMDITDDICEKDSLSNIAGAFRGDVLVEDTLTTGDAAVVGSVKSTSPTTLTPGGTVKRLSTDLNPAAGGYDICVDTATGKIAKCTTVLPTYTYTVPTVTASCSGAPKPNLSVVLPAGCPLAPSYACNFTFGPTNQSHITSITLAPNSTTPLSGGILSLLPLSYSPQPFPPLGKTYVPDSDYTTTATAPNINTGPITLVSASAPYTYTLINPAYNNNGQTFSGTAVSSLTASWTLDTRYIGYSPNPTISGLADLSGGAPVPETGVANAVRGVGNVNGGSFSVPANNYLYYLVPTTFGPITRGCLTGDVTTCNQAIGTSQPGVPFPFWNNNGTNVLTTTIQVSASCLGGGPGRLINYKVYRTALPQTTSGSGTFGAAL